MAPRHRDVDVVTENIKQGKEIPLSEIDSTGGVEPVSEAMFADDLALEAFMNEILTIVVHQDTSEGSLDVIAPNVNGINQPIVRGAKSKVKRKYVEALARTRLESFGQRQDSFDLSSIALVPRTVIAYPFSVINDPNPNGRTWLEGILAEA